MNSFRTAGNFLRALLPGTVRVQGASMAPTFNDGDWLLVSWLKGNQEHPNSSKKSEPHRGVKATNIIVAEREAQPGIFYIKRIAKIDGNRYWLSSDNSEGTDSRTWGWLDRSEIRGKVICRYYRKRTEQN